MAAAAAVIVLLSLLTSFGACQKQDTSATLLRVVGALEKLVAFYEAEYQHMNLDGLFGLKVVEGQLEGILEEHQQGQHGHLSPQVVQRLRTLLESAVRVSHLALDAVKADDAIYFKNLQFVITKPWTNFKRHRPVVPRMRWEIPVYHSSSNYTLNEEASDQCMMEVTGNGMPGTSCAFSQDCGHLMTKRGLMDYGITHQLLWTALAEKAGCNKELKALLQSYDFQDTDAMQTEFCTNNYYEMLAVVHVFMKGQIHLNYQDLFLEQQFVCPNLGFYEFLKQDYLDQILSWQWPSGCFGDKPEPKEQTQGSLGLPKLNLNTLGKLMKNGPLAQNLNLQHLQGQQQLNSLKSNNEILKSLVDFDKKLQSQVGGAPQIQNVNGGNVNQLPQNVPVGFVNPALQNMNAGDQSGRLHNVNARNINPAVLNLNAGGMNAAAGIPGQPAYRAAAHENAGGVNSLNAAGNSFGIQNRLIPGVVASLNKFNVADGEAMAAQQKFAAREAAPARGWPNVGIGQGRQPAPEHDIHAGERRMLAYKTGQGTRRKLLVEKTMPGGCLAHKTGVAAGALAMYLRYLVDPGPLDLYAKHNFFPEDGLNLAQDPIASKKFQDFVNSHVMEELDDQRQAAVADAFDAKQPAGDDENLDDEGNESEDEDAEYDDQEEMYPDRGGAADGNGGIPHERRVIRFGANNGAAEKDKGADYDKGNEDEEYANEDKDEEDEEEGPDYIKRVKGDDNAAANADEEDNNRDDDTEYTYYDDDDNTEKGIIKKHKPQPPPQPGARIRSHSRHKPHAVLSDEKRLQEADLPPTKMFVFLLSASSVLLIIFMYRFIKRRRIHLRYHSRGFFKL